MSSLRRDPTTGEWVVLAPGRAARPHAATAADRPFRPPHEPGCPFCPGNEDRTPPEICRSPEGHNWEQRVFPNLFPALERGASTDRTGPEAFREMPGVGAHEVVVETPLHDERMDEMDPGRIESILRIWRRRHTELRADPDVAEVAVFRNFGPRAGTSIIHAHSQILATPVSPPEARRRYAVATAYFDDTGRCVYEDLRDAELEAAERVVAAGEAFVAYAPFASRHPYETWIVPRERQTSFGAVADRDVPELARTLSGVLRALREAAADPDYNLVLRSAPAHEETKPFFLWHLQVLPRTTTPAGFELGSGMAINPLPPEQAAAAMREVTGRRGSVAEQGVDLLEQLPDREGAAELGVHRDE